MLLSCILVLTALLAAVCAYQTASTNGTDKLAAEGLVKLAEYSGRHKDMCSWFSLAVRQEWSALSAKEKRCYIEAVLCLQALPAQSGDFAPGARTRYDDFVAIHIHQTLTIHATGNFLSWHRYFVWSYEQALRNECGYEGCQPYWNWGKYAHDPLNSPIFDGSATSMSGNGRYRKHPDYYLPSKDVSPHLDLPAAHGGGCVKSGPFKNMKVNLGGANATAPIYPYIPANPQVDGLGYNPRCLRRDISVISSSTSTTDTNSTALIIDSEDILTFQNVMQAINIDSNNFGVHSGGHYTVGGDPGGDFFSSPGDPVFFLHHAQIDRTWWIWQNQNLEERQNSIAGTVTFLNIPPSRNATLEDLLDLGVASGAGVLTLRQAMSTMREHFCYVYV